MVSKISLGMQLMGEKNYAFIFYVITAYNYIYLIVHKTGSKQFAQPKNQSTRHLIDKI